MKKTIMALFLIFIIEFSLVAQEKKGNYFDLNLEPGKTYSISDVKNFNSKTDFFDNQEKESRYSKLNYLLKVINHNSEGYLIHLGFEAIDLSDGFFKDGLDKFLEPLQVNEVISYYKKNQPRVNECLKDLYIPIQLSNKGSLLSFEGVGQFSKNFEQALKVLGFEDGLGSVEGFNLFCSRVGALIANEAQDSFKDLFSYIPSTPVMAGDSWDFDASDGNKLSMIMTYQFDEVKGDDAFIFVRGDLSSPELEKELHGVSTKGWVNGFYVIDLSTGLVKKAHVSGVIDVDENIIIDGTVLPFKMLLSIDLSHSSASF